MRLAVLLLIAYSGWAQDAPPPPPDSIPPLKPPERCTVQGSVVNAVSGEPLKKAHVVLSPIDNNSTGNLPTYGAITGADGLFSVEEIDPGRYSIFVSRTGFVSPNQTPSKRNAIRSVLTLSAGQTMKGLRFKIVPQAVVAGRVVDEDNEPVVDANVSCMRYQYSSGNKILGSVGTASTNDKGEFRIFGLAAGKCYVSAILRQNGSGANEVRKELASEQGYVQTYYPSSVSASSAIAVNVGAGAEVSGIEIRLRRLKMVHVSGVVTNLPSQFKSAGVLLFRRDGELFGMSDARSTRIGANGRFSIRDVGPGSYTVVASYWNENQSRTAIALIDVGDAHVEGLQLALATDPEISGTLVTEGAPQRGAADASPAASIPTPVMPAQVGLYPEDVQIILTPNGSIRDDGTFLLKNIGPLRYRINVWPMPTNAYVKRVQLGDQEIKGGAIDFRSGVTARDLTITVSMNGAQIEGVVREDDQPSVNATVVLVPGDPTLRNYYADATSDQNGHYILRGVAPGKYKLYAFDEIERGAYQDPDFMQPYENHSESIEIAESAHATRDLKLILNDESAK